MRNTRNNTTDFVKTYSIGTRDAKFSTKQAKSFLSFFHPDATMDNRHCFQVFADSDKAKEKIRICKDHGTKPCKCKGRDKINNAYSDRLRRIDTDDFDDIVDDLREANRQGAGVFFTPNEMDGKGRKAQNLKRIRAVWAEMDDGLPNPDAPHKGWPIEPSMIVESSPGKHHVYWLLDDNEEMDKETFHGIQRHLVSKYGADSNAIDLTRVLRVPGFYHCKLKSDRDPTRVSFIHPGAGEGCDVYSVEGLVAAFPPEEKKKRKVRKSNQGSHYQFFSVDHMAEALEHLADGEYVDNYLNWFKIGLALFREFGDEGYGVWRDWSENSDKFDEYACEVKWEHISHADDVDENYTIGSIIQLAKNNGWKGAGDVRDNINAIDFSKPDKENAKDTGNTGLPSGIKPSHYRTPKDRLQLSEQSAVSFGVSRAGEWDEEAVEKFLNLMNKQHAYIQTGGKAGYLFKTVDSSGAPVNRTMTATDMNERYRAVRIPNPDEDDKKRKILNGFELWREWKDRACFDGSGLFPPGRPVREGFHNTWAGFGVEPVFEDCEETCEKLLEHLEYNVCRGNKEHNKYLLDWLSHMVQRPYEKPGCAVVLRSSEKGTGKSILIRIMDTIFGHHGCQISDLGKVFGRFNDYVEDKIFVGLDDVMWGGDKKSEGVLKNLITETSQSYEGKGTATLAGRNYSRLLFTSNEDWAVPAGADERRFFVLDINPVKPTHKEREEWFQSITDIAKEDDPILQRAFFGFLLKREITDFRTHSCPETEALQKQKQQGLSTIDRFVRSVAEEKGVYSKDGEKNYELHKDKTTKIPKHICIEVAGANTRVGSADSRNLDLNLGRLLAKLGVNTNQKMGTAYNYGEGKGRAPAFEFPPSPEFIEAVDGHFGGGFEFNAE